MTGEPRSCAAPVAIIGGGPVGALAAIHFARAGHDVTLHERRPDPRRGGPSAGRSINLALSVRGLAALRAFGVEDQVLAHALPMRGRRMHARDGAATFQPYGNSDRQCIHSMSRRTLNEILLTAAEREPRVRLNFESRVDRVEGNELALTTPAGARTERFERLVGADGSASAVRAAVCPEATEEALDYGYKELTLPARADASGSARFALEPDALHIWPRGRHMLIALPNEDGSFTCTLFLPFTGFGELTGGKEARAFFDREFPDASALLPDLERDFVEHPTGQMGTLRSPRWTRDGDVLLIGDAAHAIVPFYGQGLNAGLEDVLLLREGGAGWPEFERARRPDAEAIARMALSNFVEMRDRVGDPEFLRRKALEQRLLREFPAEFASRYALVTFSRAPYRAALEAGEAAERVTATLAPEAAPAAAAEVIRREFAEFWRRWRGKLGEESA